MKLIMLFSPSFCYFFLYIRFFSSATYFHAKKNMFLPEGKRADFTPEKKSIILFVVFVGRTNCVNGNLRLEFITLLREVTLCSYLEKRSNNREKILRHPRSRIQRQRMKVCHKSNKFFLEFHQHITI